MFSKLQWGFFTPNNKKQANVLPVLWVKALCWRSEERGPAAPGWQTRKSNSRNDLLKPLYANDRLWMQAAYFLKQMGHTPSLCELRAGDSAVDPTDSSAVRGGTRGRASVSVNVPASVCRSVALKIYNLRHFYCLINAKLSYRSSESPAVCFLLSFFIWWRQTWLRVTLAFKYTASSKSLLVWNNLPTSLTRTWECMFSFL